MQFNITNRWSGQIQFTAEIDCAEDAPISLKIGLSVKSAIKSAANLSEADLRGANLSAADLSAADLRGANLSAADLRAANLRDADLRAANLRDADLSAANLRGADLSAANLRDANLSDANLRAANLRDANLRAADLRAADLRAADLSDANLRAADLSDADLRDANLRAANLRDAPKIENIHQRIYEAASAPGALDMGLWHKCETTHCRAGWAVALAGDAGRELESKIGSAAAGALIYIASDPTLDRVPNWYLSDRDALEDMRICAEREKQRAA